MKKYKEFWYEIKQDTDLDEVCFYNTEDKMKHAWCFNLNIYSINMAYSKIKYIYDKTN